MSRSPATGRRLHVLGGKCLRTRLERDLILLETPTVTEVVDFSGDAPHVVASFDFGALRPYVDMHRFTSYKNGVLQFIVVKNLRGDGRRESKTLVYRLDL